MPPKEDKDMAVAEQPQPEAAAAETLPAPEQAIEPEAAPEAPKGLALLDHDDPNASATHEGVEIVRGADGLYLCPLTFVPHLHPHGFRVVSEGR